MGRTMIRCVRLWRSGRGELIFCGNDRWSGGDCKQPQVTPTSWPPDVPGRRVVPAGNRRTGCSLVLQPLQHVEPRGSRGGEDGGPDPGHDGKQDEVGKFLPR